MISSKLSANDSSPPASNAERSIGSVTRRNVVNQPAPRSAGPLERAAHSAQPRDALLKIVTQNVAWEITSVRK